MSLSTLLLFPKIDLYPAADPDSSWKAGLVMAHAHGLRFGRDLVFTYGPLGFVGHPVLWGTRSLLAIAAAFIAVGVLIFAGTRAVETRVFGSREFGSRVSGSRVLVPLAALASGLCVRVGWRYEASIVTPLVFLFLAITLRQLLLVRVPSPRRCAVSAAIAAVFVLTKVDTATYCGVALLALSLGGPERPKVGEFAKRIGLILGVFSSVLIVGWLALGQPISELGFVGGRFPAGCIWVQ